MAYKVIPFEEFKEDCRHLAAKIAKYSPTNLFGTMRGGMVVALFIAHELDMDAHFVHPIYNSKGNVFSHAPTRWPEKNDIIVDDILDTGKTEEDLQCSWPGLTIAVLYCKNREYVSSLATKLIVGRYTDTKDYLILPHEVVPDNIERI